MGRLESSIERSVCEYAKKRGVLVRKMGGYGQRGWPDRMFLYCGRVLFVEFKQAGKKPTKLQEASINTLVNQGFWVDVVDDADAGKALIDKFTKDTLARWWALNNS